MEIRNIAIIAHVDHGKTTLVDRMIYQANLVRRPEDLGNLILDNNDLELKMRHQSRTWISMISPVAV